MNELMRWNPWNRRSLVNEFEKMVDDMMRGSWPLTEAQAAWSLAIDVSEDSNGYTVKASVPGVNPEDIEITLSDNVLSIKGEVKEDQELDSESYHVRERRFGQFVRNITLPAQVDADKIEAGCKDGVLRIYVPKVEAVKPRRIQVQGVSEQKVIEADTRS